MTRPRLFGPSICVIWSSYETHIRYCHRQLSSEDITFCSNDSRAQDVQSHFSSSPKSFNHPINRQQASLAEFSRNWSYFGIVEFEVLAYSVACSFPLSETSLGLQKNQSIVFPKDGRLPSEVIMVFGFGAFLVVLSAPRRASG